MGEGEYHAAPKLDRELFQLYLTRMDAGSADKMMAFTRMLDAILSSSDSSIAISTGAGSGKLEIELARQYPNAKIVALDYSLPMIETIYGNINHERANGKHVPNIHVLQASAEYLPIAHNSVDAVIAPSFIHELASFCDGYRFGPTVDRYMQAVARSLKVGGRFVIRDFVAPDKPDEPRILRIGKKVVDTDADPSEFMANFIAQFRGWDNPEDQALLLSQGPFREGTAINLPFKYGMEIAAHYSWALRFSDEVKEKYVYDPPFSYAEHVIHQFAQAGVRAKVVARESWHQQGYSDHVPGRLDFFHTDGRPSRTPVFTGLIAVERVE
jgi:SAM-dependent methyltransferase